MVSLCAVVTLDKSCNRIGVNSKKTDGKVVEEDPVVYFSIGLDSTAIEKIIKQAMKHLEKK